MMNGEIGSGHQRWDVEGSNSRLVGFADDCEWLVVIDL